MPFRVRNKYSTSRSSKKPSPESNAIETGPDGFPVCPAGLNTNPNGADLKRRYLKFRCPRMQKGKYVCNSPCSSAKFGRTFSVAMKTNPRLYNFPPRGSPEWKKVYNARTASERDNKRIKNEACPQSSDFSKAKSSKFATVRF